MQKLICAWCLEVMRRGTTPASHGICDKCNKEHFPESPTFEEENTVRTVKSLVSQLLNFDMDALVVLELRKAPGLSNRSHIYTVRADTENTGVVTIVESSSYLTEAEVVGSARSLKSDLTEDR